MNPLTRFRDWWHRPVTDRLDRLEAAVLPPATVSSGEWSVQGTKHDGVQPGDDLDKYRTAALDSMRERDEARPMPTSVADAVCMCVYGSGGLTREYRCRACSMGFGPDRGRRETPYEQWARYRT